MNKIKIALIILPILLLAQSCTLNPFGGGGEEFSGGVMKSYDAGENWETVNKAGEQASLRGVSVARIRMDGENPDTLYLASPTHGVYKTTDGGANWTRVLSAARIYDVQINPKNNDEIFAGGSQGAKARVFKSLDAGQSWIEMYSEAGTNNFVSAIAYDSQTSQTVYIGLSTGEIIVSRNTGASWDFLSKPEGRILKISSPAGDSRKLYALSMESGLHLSTDAGASWNQISKTVDGGRYQDFYAMSVPFSIYLATSSGLYQSTNEGGTWEKMYLPLSDGAIVVSAIAVNPNNFKELFAAVAQTLYKSIDGGNTWQIRALSISGAVRGFAVHPRETNVMYLALGQVLQ